MIVYLITNKQTGQRYVGQSTKRLSVRWSEHKAHAKRGSNFDLHRAIREYGPDSFRCEVLLFCEDCSIADYEERFFIDELKTKIPHGYNLDYGRKRSAETRNRIGKGLVRAYREGRRANV